MSVRTRRIKSRHAAVTRATSDRSGASAAHVAVGMYPPPRNSRRTRHYIRHSKVFLRRFPELFASRSRPRLEHHALTSIDCLEAENLRGLVTAEVALKDDDIEDKVGRPRAVAGQH